MALRDTLRPRENELAKKYGITVTQLDAIVSEFGENSEYIFDALAAGTPLEEARKNIRELLTLEGT